MLKLVSSANMDAMLEATRVYGNLSKSKDVRDYIMQNKGLKWKQTHTGMQHPLCNHTYFLFSLNHKSVTPAEKVFVLE